MSVVKYPSPAAATHIHFTYDKTQLVQLMMEACQNMVKIAVGQNGEALVNEYAMDDDTPTLQMKQKLLDSPMSDIVDSIHRLTDDSFYTQFVGALDSIQTPEPPESSDDEGAEGEEVGEETGEANEASGNSIVIPIIYVATYRIAQLDAFDKYIRDMIIYGALVQWFTTVKADDMKASAQSEYNRARALMLAGVRELYRKVVFKKISTYTL